MTPTDRHRRALALALLGALAVAGCSTDRSSAVLPGVDLSRYRSAFVTCQPKDGAGICDYIARDLRERGWQVTTSAEPLKPREADVLVDYEDRWSWDVSVYLLTLRIDLRAPQTNLLLATSRVYRTSLARGTPASMTREALDSVFATTSAR